MFFQGEDKDLVLYILNFWTEVICWRLQKLLWYAENCYPLEKHYRQVDYKLDGKICTYKDRLLYWMFWVCVNNKHTWFFTAFFYTHDRLGVFVQNKYEVKSFLVSYGPIVGNIRERSLQCGT